MKYTEEEKKAIEYLKENSLVRLNKNNKIVAYGNSYKYYILNLLQKQQKEIEKKNKVITEVERYARGIKDEELLLILKKDEIEKLVNECEELLGE